MLSLHVEKGIRECQITVSGSGSVDEHRDNVSVQWTRCQGAFISHSSHFISSDLISSEPDAWWVTYRSHGELGRFTVRRDCTPDETNEPMRSCEMRYDMNAALSERDRTNRELRAVLSVQVWRTSRVDDDDLRFTVHVILVACRRFTIIYDRQ